MAKSAARPTRSAEMATIDVSSDGAERPRRRREQDVLNAAAKVFSERGYSDASVQEVADELGILKGSLYHYIDTKEDLLFWLLDEVHEGVGAVLAEVEATEGLGPLERLAMYVRRQILYNLDNIQRVSIYYHDMDRLSKDRLAILRERRKEHERFVATQLREAQKAGLADASLDPLIMTNCTFAAIIWTYRWYKPHGAVSRERIADMCTEFVLKGVQGGAGSRDLPAAPPARKARAPRTTAPRAR